MKYFLLRLGFLITRSKVQTQNGCCNRTVRQNLIPLSHEKNIISLINILQKNGYPSEFLFATVNNRKKRCLLKIISKILMNTKMSAWIPLKFLKNISPFHTLTKIQKNLNPSHKNFTSISLTN